MGIVNTLKRVGLSVAAAVTPSGVGAIYPRFTPPEPDQAHVAQAPEGHAADFTAVCALGGEAPLQDNAPAQPAPQAPVGDLPSGNNHADRIRAESRRPAGKAPAR